MPWSNFIYQHHWIEMRDYLVSDLVDVMFDLLDGFILSQPGDLPLAWLREAVDCWKEECELPPGCKTIHMDKWLKRPEEIEIFAAFLLHISAKLRPQPISNPVLADEAERVWLLVKELKGQREVDS
jgi:hypothetical protein